MCRCRCDRYPASAAWEPDAASALRELVRQALLIEVLIEVPIEVSIQALLAVAWQAQVARFEPILALPTRTEVQGP